MAVSPRYQAGATIEELFREHGASVQLICASMLLDRGEAEDAAQQVFLAAFRALANGTVPRNPAAWLATIARNECRARAQSSPPLATSEELVDSADTDPAVLLLRRAQVSAVWDAIGELPPTQREALLLREVRGLSYDELADDLQLTRPSIRSLLTRARQAVRARLGDGWAVLGGGSWLESLTRLLAGGSTPAIATKTVAVGLGAAAITGGAIVAPELTPHPRSHGASVSARPRHVVVVAPIRPKPNTADPVGHAPPAPVDPSVAPELVVATPVVQHNLRRESTSVRHHLRAESNERPVSSLAPKTTTFVSEHDGGQAAARAQPTRAPASGPSTGSMPSGDGESGHDQGSGPSGAPGGAGPTAVAPPGGAGEAMTQPEPSDGEGGTFLQSSNPGQLTVTFQPTVQAPVSSDGSDGSSSSGGSDGSRGD